MEENSRRNFLALTAAGFAGSAAGLVSPHGVVALPYDPAGAPPRSSSGTYDVRTFGAKGDGKTIDTPAVNKAIETASAAGGGIVRFPAGSYSCFSIHLKSKVSLYLDPG